jgi:hypothetical protein
MFEILSEILSFYAPAAEQITQTSWFRESTELQMLALKLCYFSKAELITAQNFQSPAVLQRLKDSLKQYERNFLEILVENIEYGEYLLTRSWFCRYEAPYQIRVLMLKLISSDNLIFSLSGDMLEHLDALLDHQMYGIPMPRDLVYFDNEDAMEAMGDATGADNSSCEPYDEPSEDEWDVEEEDEADNLAHQLYEVPSEDEWDVKEEDEADNLAHQLYEVPSEDEDEADNLTHRFEAYTSAYANAYILTHPLYDVEEAVAEIAEEVEEDWLDTSISPLPHPEDEGPSEEDIALLVRPNSSYEAYVEALYGEDACAAVYPGSKVHFNVAQSIADLYNYDDFDDFDYDEEEYDEWARGYYANPDSEDPDYDREQYIHSLREFEHRY